MNKKQMGYCHICGSYGELSFEHIPPKSALNRGHAKVYTGDDAIKHYTGEKSRYLNLQRGMGKYSLCESCNNNTGAWYAAVYNDVAKKVAYDLQKRSALKHGEILSFLSEEFPALIFVKQIVTMFCSLLPLKEVQRLGFDKFLLDKESNTIDKTLFDLRIYLTPANVGQLMVGPFVIACDEEETGIEIISASELAVYPFGFILNLTPQYPIKYGASLLKLFDTEYGKTYKIEWPLMYLERTDEKLPLPLQFKPL